MHKVLREEGLRSLWFKVLGEICYRRLAIIERIFDGEAEAGLRVDWGLSKLTIPELPAYHARYPETDLDELRRRMERGGWCYVIRYDGGIIHSCWIATGTVRIDYLDCEVCIGSDLVYPYEAFTVPEFRGRGVATARVRLMERHLLAEGYQGSVGVVQPSDRAALRFNLSGQNRVIGTIGFFCLGGWRRYFLRLDKALQPPAKPGSIRLTGR